MDKEIKPGQFRGTISSVPSKSAAHRVLICAALSDRPTEVAMGGTNNDIEATISCLESLGASFTRDGDIISVSPPQMAKREATFNCQESGATLRFMVPVGAAMVREAHYTGTGRLPERPIDELRIAMEKNGTTFSSKKLPFTVSGGLNHGTYELPGDISSQYISGLLLGLATLGHGGRIELTSPLESKAYVDMTINALREFGIDVTPDEKGWTLEKMQFLTSPGETVVEGDWSSAAFFVGAGALGGPVTVTNVPFDSAQADESILQIVEDMGAQVERGEKSVTISAPKDGKLQALNLDVSEAPDLLPLVAVLAGQAEGTSHFTNAARLRLKESDRITTTAKMLGALGVSVEEQDSELIVHGGSYSGGTVDGSNDHRIVMAAAIAASVATEAVTITDAQAVAKSYPSFFEDFEALGGRTDGVELW